MRDGSAPVQIVKAKGRLKELYAKTNGGQSLVGTCGIGHTRWATHGEPSETNAHPHASADGNVVAVHNGIIENYQELKEKLLHNGYTFYSQTDTEVAVKLIDYYYKKYEHTPTDALSHAMIRMRGSYALAVMFKEYPGEIYVARKDSPMIIGVQDGECYVASDVPAILKYTRKVYYIGNLEMARLANGEVTFYNVDEEVIEKPLTEIKWDAEAAEKAGFEHFMMKEIHEQPKAVRDTLNSVLVDGKLDMSAVGLSDEDIKKIDQICIVACGSAYHVGVAAQYVIEDLAHAFDLTRDSGTLYANTECGIFGKLSAEDAAKITGAALPIAKKDEVKTGKATILATVSGNETREYDIEIEKIYSPSGSTRNLLLHVTDEELLTQTGGVVQGMSGSAILQDGKIIGAVTHVLLDDPSRGYGIFIENMLSAAGLSSE